LKSFSQADTTKICVSTEVAKKVIQDLLSGDNAKQKVVLLDKVIKELETKTTNQDYLIGTLQKKEETLRKIILDKSKQLDLQQEISKEYKNKYEREVKKAKLFKSTTGIGVVGIVVILFIL
jgi:L-lactate utilization protein LutC